jgi:hypothetical protein
MLSRMRGRVREAGQRLRLSRGELFAGLFILGCANGLAGCMIQSVNRLGLPNAILATFDISVIVLIACCAGVSFVLSDPNHEVRLAEVVIGTVLITLIVLPIAGMS